MAVPSTAITRIELSSGFNEFDLAMDRKGFLGARILRLRPVSKQSAELGKVPLRELLQPRDTQRAPQSGYSRSGFTFDKFAYSVVEHGAEEPLDDAQLAAYADLLDAEMVHSERAVDAVLRNYEAAAAAKVYDPLTWTGDALTTELQTAWGDALNATPIDDVEAAANKVWEQTGVWPNTLVINKHQFDAVRKCEQVLERIKYGGTSDVKIVTRAMLAQLFDVEQVLVAGGSKNAAVEGQDAAVTNLWSSEYAMVCRAAVSADPAELCIGRTFVWTDDGPSVTGGEDQLAVIAEEYREENVRGSVFRARTNYHMVIIYPAAGHLLTNVLSK